MAAGRGEFIRSLTEALRQRHSPGGPPPPPPAPGRGGSVPGPEHRGRGGSASRRPPDAALFPVRVAPRGDERNKSGLHKVKRAPSKENMVERLPPEVLMKILSYLDSSSLFSISHVCKLLHQLANNEVLWQEIYAMEFGSPMWKPKEAEDDDEEVETVGHWRKMFFRTLAGEEMNRWRGKLRHMSPHTGLPQHTELVLRKLKVSWQLTVCNGGGGRSLMEQSRAFFFASSLMVRWSQGIFADYRQISSIQLHAVRRDRPEWRSLILKLDLKPHCDQLIGQDKLIKLMHWAPGVIIGIWRGRSSVAFIMISLHLHKLVEKSLLGSPACPYSEPMDRPVCPSHFTLHLVLHNTSTKILSGHFGLARRGAVQVHGGPVELSFIHRNDSSQHRSLCGNVSISWRSGDLEGSVQNCCIMALTLLDESQHPFWCACSPVCVAPAPPSSDYSGEHFLLEQRGPDGKVQMELVWLGEQKQFFLIGLTVHLFKVNKRFGRNLSDSLSCQKNVFSSINETKSGFLL